MYPLDEQYWHRNVGTILGIDEVGRGALAGPVVVGGVVVGRNDSQVLGVTDSKLLLARTRQRMSVKIAQTHRMVIIEQSEASLIDTIGIAASIQQAIRQIVVLCPPVDLILVDGVFSSTFLDSLPYPAYAHVKGDLSSYVIGAASIVAKVNRDEQMKRLSDTYPVYGFETNKGYGTLRHRQAIERFGLTSIHRTTFCSHLAIL
jgi:ribonuclease HII